MEKAATNLDALLRARAEIERAIHKRKDDICVLFTDVVGSTDYFERRGDTAGVALMYRHAELASAVVHELGGHVVKTIGDSVMATFSTGVPATRAAIEIQSKVQQLNESLAERDCLQLRIGINLGPVYKRDTDVFGDAVNLAARVTSEAGPAQILVSSTVLGSIAQETDIKSHWFSKVTFKGKAEPQDLFEILWTDEKTYTERRTALNEKFKNGALTVQEMKADERPSLTTPPTAPLEAGEKIGGRIGPYKLLGVLGEGGMGTVYMAEQREPIQRRVALKVIKLGMDTKAVMARFESERQALALMNHPTIAKVFDAGATDLGRPYFAMEYVQGIPISDYCDQHRLTTAERLEIFNEVCRGVHHAHQKGVIHRDLKPSNVLVQIEDGKPVPKIIDFGIAKATVHRLTEQSVYTELGQLMGTPEYMSPEQAEMSGLDVDTRTDVYSLGVILYELLTGVRPFERGELQQGGFTDLQRRIREKEHSRPSTRFRKLTDQSPKPSRHSQLCWEVAKQRHTDPKALEKLLKGDLDWIVMKAIEKDRNRRYESATEMAADISRHQRYEPVMAGPPSPGYRLGKFIRRHRVGVFAGAVLFVAIILGLVGTTHQWLRALRAEQVATEEAQASRQVADLLVNLFSVSDPSEARGETITAREILDRGVERLETDLAGQPALQARLLQTVGDVYRGLGLWKSSVPLFEKAVAERRQAFGGDDIQVAESLNRLGAAKTLMGDYGGASEALVRALEIRKTVLGPADPKVAETIRNLANLRGQQTRATEAEALYQEAISLQEASLGSENIELAATLADYGVYLAGKLTRAVEGSLYLERAVSIQEKALEPDHPDLMSSLVALANTYRQQDKYEEAQITFLRVLPIQEKVLGPTHINTAETRVRLGSLYMLRHRFDEAEASTKIGIAIAEQTLGKDHTLYANFVHVLAEIKFWQGDLPEAARLFRQAIEIKTRALGRENSDVLHLQGHLVGVRVGQGRLEEAESLIRQFLSIAQSTANLYDQGVFQSYLGNVYFERGELRRAGEAYDLAGRLYEEANNPTHVAGSLINLGKVSREEGRLDEALDLLNQAHSLVADKITPRSPRISDSRQLQGLVLRDLGRFEEALAAFQEALSVREFLYGPQDATTAESREATLGVLEKLGRQAEARQLQQ